MQLKIFTIPIFHETDEEESLNKFLRSIKVLEIKRELVTIGDTACWTVCVLYLTQNNGELQSVATKGKVDYKNVLTDSEFKRFCQLRKVRKQLAEADAVPAFAVFTDSELSEISRMDEVTVTSLNRINGVGVKRMEKYGNKFCDLFSSMSQDETCRESS